MSSQWWPAEEQVVTNWDGEDANRGETDASPAHSRKWAQQGCRSHWRPRRCCQELIWSHPGQLSAFDVDSCSPALIFGERKEERKTWETLIFGGASIPYPLVLPLMQEALDSADLPQRTWEETCWIRYLLRPDKRLFTFTYYTTVFSDLIWLALFSDALHPGSATMSLVQSE